MFIYVSYFKIVCRGGTYVGGTGVFCVTLSLVIVVQIVVMFL